MQMMLTFEDVQDVAEQLNIHSVDDLTAMVEDANDEGIDYTGIISGMLDAGLPTQAVAGFIMGVMVTLQVAIGEPDD